MLGISGYGAAAVGSQPPTRFALAWYTSPQRPNTIDQEKLMSETTETIPVFLVDGKHTINSAERWANSGRPVLTLLETAVPFWGQTTQISKVACPQNGTAVLKGVKKHQFGVHQAQRLVFFPALI